MFPQLQACQNCTTGRKNPGCQEWEKANNQLTLPNGHTTHLSLVIGSWAYRNWKVKRDSYKKQWNHGPAKRAQPGLAQQRRCTSVLERPSQRRPSKYLSISTPWNQWKMRCSHGRKNSNELHWSTGLQSQFGTFIDKKTSLHYVNTVFSHVEWRTFGEFLEE